MGEHNKEKLQSLLKPGNFFYVDVSQHECDPIEALEWRSNHSPGEKTQNKLLFLFSRLRTYWLYGLSSIYDLGPLETLPI
jgi:hypothetical protein